MKIGDLVCYKDTEGSMGMIIDIDDVDDGPARCYVEWYDEGIEPSDQYINGWFREYTLGVINETR